MLAREARWPDGREIMPEAAREAFCEHARAEFPREAIGYLTPDGDYCPLRNISSHPEAHAVADHREVADLLNRGRLAVLCHSHPGGPDCPSELDMKTQLEFETPFAIVSTNGEACAEPFLWGDQLGDARPLVGRGFRHGVDDCYALIRAYWLAEHGELLPEYPRNWEWWLREAAGEKLLYERHFADAGFREVEQAEVRPGDVWLAAVRSDTPNHGGLVLDGGLALHHPASGLPSDPGRLSKREPIARWLPYVTHWLRRTPGAPSNSPSRQAG